jgi:hypothetical protein
MRYFVAAFGHVLGAGLSIFSLAVIASDLPEVVRIGAGIGLWLFGMGANHFMVVMDYEFRLTSTSETKRGVLR